MSVVYNMHVLCPNRFTYRIFIICRIDLLIRCTCKWKKHFLFYITSLVELVLLMLGEQWWSRCCGAVNWIASGCQFQCRIAWWQRSCSEHRSSVRNIEKIQLTKTQIHTQVFNRHFPVHLGYLNNKSPKKLSWVKVDTQHIICHFRDCLPRQLTPLVVKPNTKIQNKTR